MEAGEPRHRFQEIAQALGLSLSHLESAYGGGRIQHITDFSPDYLRFSKEVAHVEEGTVVFLGKVPEYARGFPKIRRALFLRAALNAHFTGAVDAEEKLNGYNVRVVPLEGSPVAITRGGLACPYTTHHIRMLLEGNAIFSERPGLMLCGEVVGLMNPYQVKSYPEAGKFGYFVFDIRDRVTNVPLKTDEKRALLKKYGIPAAPYLGRFRPSEWKRILALTKKIGGVGREGLVLKDTEMKKQVKYTANESTNEDLAYAFKFPFDYAQAFMFRRLVREAFQAYELGLRGKKLEDAAAALGKSILVPMVETIRSVAEGREVTNDFEITTPDTGFALAFVEHLKKLGVRATVERIKDTKTGVVTRVKRHYPSTNDKIKAYLRGEFAGE